MKLSEKGNCTIKGKLNGIVPHGTHLYTRGGDRHCESKVSCPRTQHNVPVQDPNPDLSIRRPVKRARTV